MEPAKAYDSCLQLARNHYENFPVASVLLPKSIRKPVAAIYAFARTADDFADEGLLDNKTRLAKLNAYENELDHIEQGIPSEDAVFVALGHAIKKYELPVEQFRKLLSAFKQDVTKHRYDNIGEILDYCDRSANPVGHLLLALVGKNNENLLKLSNSVCTGLQLTNFLQDISVDYKIGRIYMPMDEMKNNNIDEKFIRDKKYNQDWQNFINQQLKRAHNLLVDGFPLGGHLGFRLGNEIKLTVSGGLKVLDRLQIINQHQFLYQARLNMLDWNLVIFKSLLSLSPGKIS
ncbi:MAG: squalene synthase HpnC [Acidiferrobacterales bacterium]